MIATAIAVIVALSGVILIVVRGLNRNSVTLFVQLACDTFIIISLIRLLRNVIERRRLFI